MTMRISVSERPLTANHSDIGHGPAWGLSVSERPLTANHSP